MENKETFKEDFATQRSISVSYEKYQEELLDSNPQDNRQARLIKELADELRQETIEEIAEKYSKNKLSKLGFINGYKLAQERGYSVEEVLIILQHRDYHMNNYDKLHGGFQTPKEWFEQFKKK